MSSVKSSSVFVKVAMVLMLVLSVLVSGCKNDEEEWKKARSNFTKNYNIMVETYNKRSLDMLDTKDMTEYQKDTFYIAREHMIIVEEYYNKLKSLVKDKEDRKKVAQNSYLDLEDCKKHILSIGRINKLVPKEHVNFDKNVAVPKIEDEKYYRSDRKKSGVIKGVYPKIDKVDATSQDVKVKKEETKDNQPKQTSATEKKDVESTGKVGVITGTEVRFRQEGNLNGKILGHFEKGEKVTVLSNENGWCKVKRQDGTVGYVSSDFCK